MSEVLGADRLRGLRRANRQRPIRSVPRRLGVAEMTTGSWEDVIQRIEEFRRAVEGRADGRGGSLADLKRHRDRILEAIRALPDRRERIAIAALQGLLAADPTLDLPYEQSAMMARRTSHPSGSRPLDVSLLRQTSAPGLWDAPENPRFPAVSNRVPRTDHMAPSRVQLLQGSRQRRRNTQPCGGRPSVMG